MVLGIGGHGFELEVAQSFKGGGSLGELRGRVISGPLEGLKKFGAPPM